MDFEAVENLNNEDILKMYEDIIEGPGYEISGYFCWALQCTGSSTIQYYCQGGGIEPGEEFCFRANGFFVSSRCSGGYGYTCTQGYTSPVLK